jgi:AcrR family transcriptional regulator
MQASVRAIATEAGVDAALVHHYFGTKDKLFIAALRLPVDPREVLGGVADGPIDSAAERLLRVFLNLWDDPANQPALVALARTITQPEGGNLVNKGFLPLIVVPVVDALGVDRPTERIPLVASQLIGLIVVRYLLRLEPLASLPAEQVVVRIAPNIQRYLTSPLPD